MKHSAVQIKTGNGKTCPFIRISIYIVVHCGHHKLLSSHVKGDIYNFYVFIFNRVAGVIFDFF